MKVFKDILKGIVIGIANIIPGVSGGTMAVTMGIYDKMIEAVNNLFKKFKESIKVLLPLFIGMGVGIVGLSFILEYLLENYPLQTNSAFIGLIVGGIPLICNRLKASLKGKDDKLLGFAQIAVFIVFFALIVGMQLVSGGEDNGSGITLSIIEVVKLIIIGVIASATMIVPGVSGSMVLMILGYYQPIIETINGTMTALKDFDINGIMHGIAVLCPFGIGVVVGIFAIAKLISFLFKNYEKLTYFAILGLIAASPIAILLNTNMKTGVIGAIIAIICFVAGFACARLLGGDNE